MVIFLILIVASNAYTGYKKGQWEKDIRSEILNVLTGKKSNLEKALFSRIFYTRGIAAYVSLNPEISDAEFSELAREYIRNDTVISTIALSKDGIINSIYPFEGHEAAIGLNLLDHPERKEIVEKTIETGMAFVAGPVELVEGGIAFISYTPIFDKTEKGNNKFWGVTDIVVKQNSLLNEAKLKQTESGYSFALRGYNGKGADGHVFWGDENIFNNNPVLTKIELPIGNWELAAVPERGWNLYPDQDKTVSVILFISAFIISLLIWFISKALIEIRNSEKKLKAVLNSIDSLIMEFNADGDYLQINSENEELLFIPKEELEGKNLKDIFDPETAKFFIDSIKDCIKNKKLVVIEYPLQIKNEERWFMARLSNKGGLSVIFNAYDITDRKLKEKLLIDSEKQLKQLNEMKNNFFSVIAHDIKGPLGSQKAIINLLMEQFHELDEVTLQNFLKNLQISSNNLYVLLEDLLKWSLSQSGKIEVLKETFNLNENLNGVLSNLLKDAQQKNIRIINELEENVKVVGDNNLTKTILRNLITNAIKFTKSGGEIRIFTEKHFIKDTQYHAIFVADTGVGMEPEVLNSLFKLDKTQTRPGTANEKGNGLGLLLCKEFAEKQNSKMEVSSFPGEGSKFSFKLPAG